MSANLKMHYIDMRVAGGATIGPVIREAITVSMEHQCDVKFEFNGKEYVVNYEDIFRKVAEQYE